MSTLEERFWAKVESGPGDCWTWTGSAHKGYGRFGANGRTVKSHRWAYEYMVAEIPEGLVIDHLCLNRSCVNPDHMDPVPQSVNAARSNAGPNHHGGRTHCKRGHEFTPKNTGRDSRGDRYCRTCMRMHYRNWQIRTGRKVAA